VTPRQLLEEAGVIWTRRERRRLARAGAGRGRRNADEVPRTRPDRRILHDGAYRLEDFATLAMMAAPELKRCDITVRKTNDLTMRVGLSGPCVTTDVMNDVSAYLWKHTPMGIALIVARDEAP
jgi:hypothetical protein